MSGGSVTDFSSPPIRRPFDNQRMVPVHRARTAAVAIASVVLVVIALVHRAHAQTDTPSIAGAWALNKDLSDQPSDRGTQRDSGAGPRNGGFGGGGRRRGGFGGGGFGGGYGGGGGYGRGPQTDPETAQRLREAMRDITNPPDHLTITQTDSMIVLTAPDGHTTRLSPDGKKIKDDNTGIERKTKWDNGKLVSEISGLGQSKVTQTYAINPELRQLRITAQIEGGNSQARTVTHVYDPDKSQQ